MSFDKVCSKGNALQGRQEAALKTTSTKENRMMQLKVFHYFFVFFLFPKLTQLLLPHGRSPWGAQQPAGMYVSPSLGCRLASQGVEERDCHRLTDCGGCGMQRE